jgi:c-di-GMP-binding flagellar brake protein YcgR
VSRESRKNKRFDAKEGATAAVVTPDDQECYTSIGQIVDISMGGLSLQYDAKTDSYHGIMELDVEIFGYSSQRMRMYVGRLPCKVVYDRLVTTDEQKSLDTRRLGLEFSDVPYYRLHKLGNFVELFALMQKDKENKDKD